MKLFSWAQKKLPSFNHSSDKNQPNAGRLSDIRRQFHACDENIQSTGRRDTHAEVLTIGTLGIGNLLSLGKDKDEEEQEEDHYNEYDEDEVAHCGSPSADLLSPPRKSTSSNRELISLHRESVSSNRESVSSIDIQKLQEELQKILYFKLGQQAGTGVASSTAIKGGFSANISAACRGGKKSKAGKQKLASRGDSRDGEGKSVRELLPLHSFLEVPMDRVSYRSRSKGGAGEWGFYKLLCTKRHYLLLMQSLKSRLLHYVAMPTVQINIPPPLFESLVSCNKPTSQVELKERLPLTTMDKAHHLFQKVTKKAAKGWKRRHPNADHDNERLHTFVDPKDEEESLNWAISRSHRGSERFINYITNTLAQIDKKGYSAIEENQQQGQQYDYALLQCQEGGNIQGRLCNLNESWINTDDEYLVLEL
ncbi:hypothetical protein L7F22_048396 [Adiantum nelumboides]|nr:hypothetical protein [Adiantum nelumboides]